MVTLVELSRKWVHGQLYLYEVCKNADGRPIKGLFVFSYQGCVRRILDILDSFYEMTLL